MVLPHRTFRTMIGKDDGTTGVDDHYGAAGMAGFGAFILGRNMFGPIRGEWPDEEWKGWWGPNPPYHAPTFILTHYAREPIVMEGGTTFHFITGGIEEALKRPRLQPATRTSRSAAASAPCASICKAGLIDEMQFAISPVVLGKGEAMFEGIDLPALGFSGQIPRDDGTGRACRALEVRLAACPPPCRW